MKSFYRSLRYLRPYRVRLGVAILLAVLMAGLWGGGLGMLLPGLKILISEEGLHGWAWNRMTGSRIGGRVLQRTVPAGTDIEGKPVTIVLDVMDIENTSSAAQSGLNKNRWLVGTVSPDGGIQFIRGDVLARKVALHTPAQGPMTLAVYDPVADKLETLSLTLGKLDLTSELLGRFAQAVPEPQSRRDRIPLLVRLLVLVAIITVLRNLLRFFQEYLVQTAVLRGMWDLRTDSYNASLRQPVTYFAEAGTTDTMSRFVQDTTELGRAQQTLFGKTVVEPAKMLGALGLALWLSWELTLIAFIAGPFAFVIIRKLGKAIRRSTKRALESWADMLAVLEETLTGIRVVKSYTMEAAERKRFFRVNRHLYKQQRRVARADSATSPTVEVLGLLAGCVAAGGAGSWVLRGQMDGELFITWMVALVGMFDPIRKLSKVVTRFHRGDAAAERIYELIDRPQEKRVAAAPMLPRLAESIRLEDVSFTYPGVKAPSVRDVNLEIRAGQTVAVVGPNGSGKTTLVSLLPRLLECTEGRIFLDGCDIRTHSLRSLRRQIGLVTQETVIFNATIAENISYGLRRASREQVLDAARKAFVDEIVRDMPNGFDTMVGQRGATLSGGQRQRIAIARAILRDPAVLIFDEAMSQVDADSERRIHQALEEFIRGRTAVMIAHRFATVRSADQIVVMADGGVIDVGTHEELLDRCELYEHLYKTQFADTVG